MGNQLGDGVGGDHGVGVDADEDLLVHALERVVERGGLAFIALGENLNAAGGDLLGVGRGGHFGGAVLRAVVDDDDVEVLVVGVEHRADGADDDRLFVVSGNENRDARVVAGRGLAMRLAQAVDDGEEADDDEARAHQNVADEEDHDDEVADDVERGEGDGIGDGAHALPEGKRRHHLRGGLAHERGDGNDGVAVGAQGVDQRSQSAPR